MILLLVVLLAGSAGPALAQDGSEGQAAEPLLHPVEVGDTWDALSRRYGVSREELQAANPHPNPYRQPAIGSTIQVPAAQPEQPGLLLRSDGGGLLRLAARHRLNPWALARLNGIGHEKRLRDALSQASPLKPPPLRDDCFALPPGIDWTPVDEAGTRRRWRLTGRSPTPRPPQWPVPLSRA